MFSPIPFRRNHHPTLGVEIELQLVDARTFALRSAILDLLRELPDEARESIQSEFMQCYVEINTDICRTVAEVETDLAGKVRAVEQAADRRGVGLFWAATHPFSRWQDQRITPNERYYQLAALLRETVVRPVTFGLHVHVGVESGDKAVQIGDRLQGYLPLLLALSANSPFWNGRPTGHQAHRIELLEAFPTGGLPPRLESWREYVGLVERLKSAGFIQSPKELWWDVRPCAENGTVEVRICDMPSDLTGVANLSALIQCLVADLSSRIDRWVSEPEAEPIVLRQNRWRAYRFGMNAAFVDPSTWEAVPARAAAERLVARLRPVAERLDCAEALGRVVDMAYRPTGAERQEAIYDQTGDLAEVVRRSLSRSRLTKEKESDFPYSADRDPRRRIADEAEMVSPYRFAAQAGASIA